MIQSFRASPMETGIVEARPPSKEPCPVPTLAMQLLPGLHSEFKFTRCGECGAELLFECVREAMCHDCGADESHPCDCRFCDAQDRG